MSAEQIRITILDIFGDKSKKGRLPYNGNPLIPIVSDGKIIHWDGVTTMMALTEIRSRANYHKVPKDRFRAYNKAIQVAAKHMSPTEMRRVVIQFPECVIQESELQGVPDTILIEAAKYMTEAIY